MKKRKILIVCFCVAIFIIPIATFASIKLYSIDTEGRTIVYSSDDINDLEQGTQISLAIPANTTIDSEILDKDIEEQKKIIKQNATLNNAQLYSATTSNTVVLESDIEQFENVELETKEEQFKNIFSKYYGESYSAELFSKINKEVLEMSGEYEIPESSKIMLEKAIQLLENTNLTENEKSVIKYILDAIDTSFIEDKEILEKLERNDIEIDK